MKNCLSGPVEIQQFCYMLFSERRGPGNQVFVTTHFKRLFIIGLERKTKKNDDYGFFFSEDSKTNKKQKSLHINLFLEFRSVFRGLRLVPFG